jgi:hypothetical protein
LDTQRIIVGSVMPEHIPEDRSTDALTGRSFIDQLLLAIIDAHPPPVSGSSTASTEAHRREREVRLAQAKAALFGEDSASGMKEIDDERALLFMALEHDRDLTIVEMAKAPDLYPNAPRRVHKPRSVRQLAQKAAPRALGNSDAATEDRLRKKFAEQQERLLAIVRHHNFIPESLERSDLLAVLKIFRHNGIASHEPR